jgi:hypothetical protein
MHIYTVFAPYSPLTLFLLFLPLPLVPTSQDRTSSALLFSDSVKEKKMTFLFVKDAYTGSILVTFPCIYVL